MRLNIAVATMNHTHARNFKIERYNGGYRLYEPDIPKELSPRLEAGSMGKWLAGFNAALNLMAAERDQRADVLRKLLVEVDDEIEQRKTSGNDEYWHDLNELSKAGHRALGVNIQDAEEEPQEEAH